LKWDSVKFKEHYIASSPKWTKRGEGDTEGGWWVEIERREKRLGVLPPHKTIGSSWVTAFWGAGKKSMRTKEEYHVEVKLRP